MCFEPGVNFGPVVSFNNVGLSRTAGAAGELNIRWLPPEFHYELPSES